MYEIKSSQGSIIGTREDVFQAILASQTKVKVSKPINSKKVSV